MVDEQECLRRALNAERAAAKMPPGFERDELRRLACAYRDVAELVRVQEKPFTSLLNGSNG